MRIPQLITAGDSAQWLDYSFVDQATNTSIDASAYTLSYSLRGPAAALDLTATTSGTGWQTAITTTQSAALNATSSRAIWYWTAYASKTGARLTAGSGTLIVEPNLAAISGIYDGRSKAEANLAAVETEITARVNGGATVEYSIGNRSLKKEPLAALMALRSQLRLQVARERQAERIKNGLGNPQRLAIRFRG